MSRVLLTLLVAAVALTGAAEARADSDGPDPEPVVSEGVTIAGLDVAGLTELEARDAALAWFAKKVKLRFKAHRLRAHPVDDLRSRACAGKAARAAIAAAAGTEVPLRVRFKRGGIKRWVKGVANRFNRSPRNSKLVLRGLRPHITKPRYGRRIKQTKLKVALRRAVWNHERGTIKVRLKPLRPTVTRGSFGPTIVIRRGSKRLYLYRRNTFKASFGVATGLPQYPTPLGRFSVVTMQRNPWWYPPSAGWAAGADPIPPGPGNPLGTRWMGLSVGAVGIHGTPDAASIGYSASHGCIRMRIPDAEWLFERIRVGSTVFIVGA